MVFVDPSFHKAEQKRQILATAAKTLRLVSRAWFDHYYNTWSEEHAKRLWYRLNKGVLNDLGHIPITQLTPQVLLICLQRIEKESPERAIWTLFYLSRIFEFAELMGWIERDLTFGLKGALKKPKRGPYACIPLEELPAFVKALYGSSGKVGEGLRCVYVKPYKEILGIDIMDALNDLELLI